jgi:hypothetical protein
LIEALAEAAYGDDPKRLRQILIPKARQLGMSTTVGIFCVDMLLFCSNRQISLVDKRGMDATTKLNKILKVALLNLPEWLKSRVEVVKSNDTQVAVRVNHKGQSSFFANTSARGGSNDFLWVSEWGWIQMDDPRRSSEIRSGALETVKSGVTVVETTWAGGKGGDVWELIKDTLNGVANDWKIMFCPWWRDPRNTSESAVIDKDAQQYFAKIKDRLTAAGVHLTEQQMRWWAAKRRQQGVFMARENPTFLDECWSAPVQGAVYAAAVDRARTEGRITPMPIDGSSLVSTAWDLGAPQNTKVWYFQVVGREVRFIDYDGDFSGTLTERVAMMIAKGYNFGAHFFPHDVQQTERTGTTMLTEIQKSGLPGKPIVVPRTHSAWVGINHMLELFPALAFRSPQCDAGLDGLSAYRTKRQGEGALTTDEPVHDWASHVADAVRVFAEGHRAGLWQFKNTTAEVKADWYGLPAKRRGMKQQRVS